MNSLIVVLFICSGLGGEGSTCNNYTVAVPSEVYQAICLQEPVTDTDWAVIDSTLAHIAPQVDAPEFVVESIDCLGS